MCLAVPGKILLIEQGSGDSPTGAVGTVDFQGSRLEVNLAMAPEANVGDWVLVHAGFAITLMDAKEARQTWEYLEQMSDSEMPPELSNLNAQAVDPPGDG